MKGLDEKVFEAALIVKGLILDTIKDRVRCPAVRAAERRIEKTRGDDPAGAGPASSLHFHFNHF